MEIKNKFKIIGFLFILVIILLFIFFFVFKTFWKNYKTCEDDFEVIEKCKCLPEEGNYSYFNYNRSKYLEDLKDTNIKINYTLENEKLEKMLKENEARN